MKLCASFKPIHCKLFLGLYDMRDLSGFSPLFKNSQLIRRGGEQHSGVLCCSVIPASPPDSLLRPKLSHRRQKALDFHHGTDEGVCC